MDTDELKRVIKQWREVAEEPQNEVLKLLSDEIDRIDRRIVALRPQGDVILIRELETFRNSITVAISILTGLAKG